MLKAHDPCISTVLPSSRANPHARVDLTRDGEATEATPEAKDEGAAEAFAAERIFGHDRVLASHFARQRPVVDAYLRDGAAARPPCAP